MKRLWFLALSLALAGSAAEAKVGSLPRSSTTQQTERSRYILALAESESFLSFAGQGERLEWLRSKQEAARLQGTWAASFGQYNGARWSIEKVARFRLTFNGGCYKAAYGDRIEEGSYLLKPGAKPKALHLRPSAGPLAGATIRALYELEPDRLVLCLAAPDTPRPLSFSAEEGSEQVLITFYKP
jgi:uncharacterized protein (TIGR03067 family)